MAKARDYSKMDIADIIASNNKVLLEKIVKTQAERYNKQITRAKKAGLSLATVGGDKRFRTQNLSKLTMAQLANQYFEAKERMGAGASKKGIKENESRFMDRLKYIFKMSDPSDADRFNAFRAAYIDKLTDKQLIDIVNLTKQIESILGDISELWYNDTLTLVQYGKVNSMSVADVRDAKITDYGYKGMKTYMQDLLNRISGNNNDYTKNLKKQIAETKAKRATQQNTTP